MTAEELYEKEFGNADSIPKESVLRLLKNFAKALKLEREQALRIHAVVGQSEQLVCPHQATRTPHEEKIGKCRQCGRNIKAN